PPAVIRHWIDAEPDDLDVALVEFRLELRHVTELGRTHRCEVFRVREDHRPGVADPLMELDAALCGVGLEIRCNVADAQTHCPLLSRWTSVLQADGGEKAAQALN